MPEAKMLKNIHSKFLMNAIDNLKAGDKTFWEFFREIAQYCLTDKETFSYFRPIAIPEPPGRYSKFQRVKDELTEQDKDRYYKVQEIKEHIESVHRVKNINRARYLWLLKLYWFFDSEKMYEWQSEVTERLLTFNRNDMNMWGSEDDRTREGEFIKRLKEGF